MARQTWENLRDEAVRELRSRTDITTRVEVWLREAYVETINEFRFHEIEKSQTFSLLAANSEIALSAIASDVKNVLSIRDTTNKKKVRKSNFRWIDNRPTASGAPSHYCRFGADLLFDAAPLVDTSYRLRYRKQIIEPVFTGTVYPETPTEWDEIIRVRAVARGFSALFEDDLAQVKMDKARELVASIPMDEVIEAEDDDFGITVRTRAV